MRRFTWFKPYRRHFLSSVSSQSLVDKGDSFGNFFSSRESLFLARTLFGCSFVTKKEESLIPRIPLSYRYFQATGYSSSAERDYYRILGVPENASQEEIKKAFHSTLRDSKKRTEYDTVAEDPVFVRDGADISFWHDDRYLEGH